MSEFAYLKTTLKRGALITAANWPVVLVQFIAESTFKLLLGVPVAGGVLLVALALGRDVEDLLRGGPREIFASVAGALFDHPGALASFLLSAAVTILGGSILMFFVKAGTVSVLVRGAAEGGAVERSPLRLSAIRRAAVFSIPAFIDACARLSRRFLRLGLILLGVYALSGGVFLLTLVAAYRLASDNRLLVAWTMAAALLSSVLIVWITIVNLLYLLVQMIIAAEDCGVREAARRTMAFLRRDLRPVAMVFVVVLALALIAMIASMLATAGLGLVSFVPLVGLAVLPLQAAAWLVRGLVFQYLGLAALGAYLSLYRPADAERAPTAAASPWVRTAS